MFELRGVVEVEGSGDELEMTIMESGADDYEMQE